MEPTRRCSTGSSLAFVCAAKGYRFVVVSSDAFSPAKLRTMTALGAELTIEPSLGGKVTPDLVPRMVAAATELADQPGTYFTDQLRNSDSLVRDRPRTPSAGFGQIRRVRPVAEELAAGHTVVTVAVDTGLKYLDGDLFVVPTDSQI